MKTLLVTSIYSNLWGTEFGGRPSRFHHYRLSLLSILNLQPSKVICYTSEEEFESLENFFYKERNVSPEVLELRKFNLLETKYFSKIREKKDLDGMKTFDRCFEVQYNKFFWLENSDEINEYDRVFWFDAGLSHSGLFPECFAYGTNNYERYFSFNVFNPSFLDKINQLTNDTFLLLAKNNTGAYYWSTTIPEKYYSEYRRDLHVVGGFFGGKPEVFKKVIDNFDTLVQKLLEEESILYMEEQILSCLYFNNPSLFSTLVFDDWYKKENYIEGIKLFYEVFLTSDDCTKLTN